MRTKTCHVIIGLIITALLLPAWPALASDSSTANWRPTYDLIMMWVNFVILAAVLIKLLRKPLKNFFATQRQTLASQIEKLEAEKKKADDDIRAIRLKLERQRDHFDTVRNRIIAQGEKQCDVIIEQARQQAKLMMTATKQRISANLREANTALKEEIVETAVMIATKTLPTIIDAKDNQKWVERFVEQISSDADTL